MRITDKILENRVKLLNEATNNPIESHSKDENGRYKSMVGNYHIFDGNLAQMTGDGGSVTIVLYGSSKRDLYDQINALIKGVEIGKKL